VSQCVCVGVVSRCVCVGVVSQCVCVGVVSRYECVGMMSQCVSCTRKHDPQQTHNVFVQHSD